MPIDSNLKLRKIAREIENCTTCQKDSIGKAVPGEGNPDAKIMFVGEAPGKTEAATGRPFVGRSGKFLRETLFANNIKPENVFITSPVKYLPKRGTPSSDQIQHGKVHFDKQVEIINPKIIVLMGSVAVQAVLNEKMPILKVHGSIIERNGKHYLIALHPAAAIRFVKYRKLFQQDIEKIRDII